MRETDKIVTTVNAEGILETDFDMARFVVTTSSLGLSGKDAKDNLKKVVDELVSLYNKFRSEGTTENLRTNVSVQPRHEYNDKTRENKLVGYEAKYSMVFHTTNLDKVSTIHDKFTSITGVQAQEPTFDVQNKSGLNKEVFKAAFVKCQQRFNFECEVLGKDPTDYQVGSWTVHYSEDERRGVGVRSATAYQAMGGPTSHIEIHSGRAEVTCSLSVSFTKKE